MAQSSPERFRSRHQFQNAFGLAMDSIRAHKLRSFLTLLGVIIGVASVIMVGAAIDGLGVYAEAEHRQGVRLGILPGGADRGHRQAEPPRVLRQDQAQQADPPRRRALSGSRQRRRRALQPVPQPHLRREARKPDLRRHHHHRRFRRHGRASATSEWWTAASSPTQEDRSRAFVAVIGETVRDTLFPGDASPLGQIVRIEGIEFTVVGVQEKLGSAFGRDQDKSIYIPVTAFDRMYGPGTGFALVRPAQAGQRPEPGAGARRDARGAAHALSRPAGPGTTISTPSRPTPSAASSTRCWA